MKPYYQDDAVTIYHGDCREILPHLTPVDLVLTDIPYGAVNREDHGLRNLDKGSADLSLGDEAQIAAGLASSSIYIFCGTEQVSQIRQTLAGRGLSTRLCVWIKTNPSPMNGQFMWLSSIECCVYARAKGAVFNEHCHPCVFVGPTCETNGHPTVKPLWLFKKLVAASSNPGGLVLDPFLGSGTTLRAAKDLGRKAIGIEIEERYCEIAAKRMAQGVIDFTSTAQRRGGEGHEWCITRR